MSWIFSNALLESLPCSQGVEEESSGVISSDGAQCALWNGTPTQPPSWCSDRTIKAFQFSQSGMMFRPLTDDLGEAVLTLFLEAFPARTSAPPEKEQELMGSDQGCGDTWRELLVQYDQSSASWKTAHCLWEEDLPESSVILPPWGMMRGGECWERQTPERHIYARGSGLWPTPTKHDHKSEWSTRGETLSQAAGSERGGDGLRLNPTWVEWLMGWPLGWTDCEPLATGKFQAWLRSHGRS